MLEALRIMLATSTAVARDERHTFSCMQRIAGNFLIRKRFVAF
jgi:hypothetical protein